MDRKIKKKERKTCSCELRFYKRELMSLLLLFGSLFFFVGLFAFGIHVIEGRAERRVHSSHNQLKVEREKSEIVEAENKELLKMLEKNELALADQRRELNISLNIISSLMEKMPKWELLKSLEKGSKR